MAKIDARKINVIEGGEILKPDGTVDAERFRELLAQLREFSDLVREKLIELGP